jgi:hypothetical protein
MPPRAGQRTVEIQELARIGTPIELADQALCRAQQQGRNQLALAT